MYKLLLADDSVTIQRVIELTFSGEDVQVVAVNDGEQAIARIPLEQPDVVLADIGMPRKGGYDVAAFVKGRPDLAHIPVLLLAGAFEPVDQARAEQVRADGVLIKPFEPRQVIERVKELLAAGRHRRADHTSPIIEGSLAHPVVDAVEEEVSTSPPIAQAAAPPTASDGGQSLDDLFESLNQALSATALTPSALVAPASAEPEMTFEALVVEPEPAGSLDDYFDRLSAAFTYTRTPATLARIPERFEGAVGAAPALDAAGPPHEWLTLPYPPDEDARNGKYRERDESNPILDAVSALLALPPWRASEAEDSGPEMAAPAPVAYPQDIVDAVTERVLAKLAPAVAESLKRIAQQEVERRRQGGN